MKRIETKKECLCFNCEEIFTKKEMAWCNKKHKWDVLPPEKLEIVKYTGECNDCFDALEEDYSY